MKLLIGFVLGFFLVTSVLILAGGINRYDFKFDYFDSDGGNTVVYDKWTGNAKMCAYRTTYSEDEWGDKEETAEVKCYNLTKEGIRSVK